MAVTCTHLDADQIVGSGNGGLTISGITGTVGRLLGVAVNIIDPFDAQTVSSVAWNGNSFSSAVSIKGVGGAPLPWMYSAIWIFQVASGGTDDVDITLTGNTSLSGSAIRAGVFEIDGHDIADPVGDTDSLCALSDPTGVLGPLTLTTGVDDLVVDCVGIDSSGTDKWVQVRSGTVSVYNNDPSPGVLSDEKWAVGKRLATGGTTEIGWDCYQFISSPVLRSTNFAHVAVSFNVAGGGGGVNDSFFGRGVRGVMGGIERGLARVAEQVRSPILVVPRNFFPAR